MIDSLAQAHSLLLPIHIGSAILSLLIVVSSDLYGARWIFGFTETLSLQTLKWFHRLVWIGLGVTATAGLGLFLPYASFLITDPAFITKLVFIVFLVVNGIVIGKHIHIASTQRFADLSRQKKAALLCSGFVSITGWIGALSAAQFIPL